MKLSGEEQSEKSQNQRQNQAEFQKLGFYGGQRTVKEAGKEAGATGCTGTTTGHFQEYRRAHSQVLLEAAIKMPEYLCGFGNEW